MDAAHSSALHATSISQVSRLVISFGNQFANDFTSTETEIEALSLSQSLPSSNVRWRNEICHRRLQMHRKSVVLPVESCEMQFSYRIERTCWLYIARDDIFATALPASFSGPTPVTIRSERKSLSLSDGGMHVKYRVSDCFACPC